MPGTRAKCREPRQILLLQGKMLGARANIIITGQKYREPGQNAGNQGKMLGARANIIITGQKKKSGSIILGIIISNKNSPNSYYFEGIFGGVSEACFKRAVFFLSSSILEYKFNPENTGVIESVARGGLSNIYKLTR
jgi:hypothetical protein